MASASESLFVRPYNPQNPKDYEAVLKICEDTVPSHLSYDHILPIMPYLYAVPYLHLSPTYAFVLEDTALQKVVGYILGTPSNTAFVSAYKETYLPDLPSLSLPTTLSKIKSSCPPSDSERTKELLEQKLSSLRDPNPMLFPDNPEFLEKYPAHLHIDILSDYTGKGYGQQLMAAFLEKLKGEGVVGVHLGMGKDNHGAGHFYRRLGFEEVPDVEPKSAAWFGMKLQ